MLKCDACVTAEEVNGTSTVLYYTVLCSSTENNLHLRSAISAINERWSTHPISYRTSTSSQEQISEGQLIA